MDSGVYFVAFGSGSVPLAALWWNDPSCRDLPAQGANPGLRAERIALCLEQMEHVCTTPPSPPEPLHLLQMDFWGEIVRVCRPPGVSCSTALGVERSFQGSGLLCLCAILGAGGGGGGPSAPTPMAQSCRAQLCAKGGPPYNHSASQRGEKRGGEARGERWKLAAKAAAAPNAWKKTYLQSPFLLFIILFKKKKKKF